MDLAWFRWLVLAVRRVPRVRCGPHDAHLSTRPFHFTPSNHGHLTTVVPRYGNCPTMVCLGDASRVTQWRSKPVHIMEIQAGSHNGPSRLTQWSFKPVYTIDIQDMEMQSRFTQWRLQPVDTMEIQAGSHNAGSSRSTERRSKASSHNGDTSRFTQWSSSRFTQCRSKPVHTMEIQISS